MSASPEEIRAAFRDAANQLLVIAEAVPTDGWTRPALGEWNVRDLLGHAVRATLTVETYLENVAQPPVTLSRPADYFLAAIDTADHKSVAERGREAGRGLGADPAAEIDTILRRALPKVDAAADDRLLPTPFGSIRLIDYLVTRIFEMTIHELDLSGALDLRDGPPLSAQSIAITLTGEILVGRGLAPAVLLATTGRAALPPGFTLF
jgi:uncharacterized protein (TIGR03083 family)